MPRQGRDRLTTVWSYPRRPFWGLYFNLGYLGDYFILGMIFFGVSWGVPLVWGRLFFQELVKNGDFLPPVGFKLGGCPLSKRGAMGSTATVSAPSV